MKINGMWADEWSPVVDAFAANFIDAGEQGASVAIYHRGVTVVNIWAGERSHRLTGISGQSWNEHTLVNLFSAGKGLVALCVLRLVAEGKLELDTPVAHYWPEFSAANKASITVRDVLSHRSGLSAFQQHIPDSQIFDWVAMTNAVSVETPWWEPRTAQGYSPFIFGWILGELVRRVSGAQSFNEYFQDYIAHPVNAEIFFGVPDNRLEDIADTGPLKRGLPPTASSGADSAGLGRIMKSDPRGVTNRAFSNPITLMTATNSQAWRQAQIPAANAHGTAHGLARIYGDLANNGSLLSKHMLPLCFDEQTFLHDQVLGLPLRFSNGFMLSQDNRDDSRYGRGDRAFGHPGAGGCVGFADPDFELGFGYVTHRMGQSLLIDARAVRLIDAAYLVAHK